MSTSYLLDTSVLVFVLKENPVILKRTAGADLYVSSISLGELYYGAQHSIYVEKSLRQVNTLEKSITILEANEATALINGRL